MAGPEHSAAAAVPRLAVPEGKLHVRLLTPRRSLFDGTADSVSAISAGGAIQILPDHGPLVTPLDVAVLTVGVGEERRQFAVHGGFLEVREGLVRILAAAAEPGGEIDVDRARIAAERSRLRIEEASAEEIDRDRAEQALARALLRMRMMGLD